MEEIIATIVSVALKVLNKKKYEEREVDKTLYLNIRENILPQNGSIKFIREQQFGSAFRIENLKELKEFVYEMEKTSSFFFDSELESIRHDLNEYIIQFNNLISNNTYQIDIDIQSIEKKLEYTNHNEFIRIVTEIENKADNICRTYDILITVGKRKLRV